MRRSSRRLLIIAAILCLGSLVASLSFQTPSAPPISRHVAEDLLARGKYALEQRDANAIVSLFAPNAKILGRSPQQLRPAIEQAMRELDAGGVTVDFSKLEYFPSGDGAIVNVTLDISQHFANVDASYFRPRVLLRLQKVSVARFLGAFPREEWRISLFEADRTLQIPFR